VNRFAKRPGEQIAHPGRKPVDIERHWLQRALTRELQKPLRESGGAEGAVEGAVYELVDVEVAPAQPSLNEIKTAYDPREHVVEVMRDPARQLSDSFHLLGLPKRFLGLHPARHFISDTLFKLVIEAGKRGVCTVGLSTGFEQLLLVASAIGRLEHRNADECPRVAGRSALNGVHENWNGLRARRNVESHLVEETLHLEQWRKMRLEIDLAGNSQEIGKALANEALRIDAEPAPESVIATLNPRICTKRQVTAWRILEQVLKVVIFDPDQRRALQLQISLDGGDRFVWCTQVGAVSGGLKDRHRAV
jgi:hypothetical protein